MVTKGVAVGAAAAISLVGGCVSQYVDVRVEDQAGNPVSNVRVMAQSNYRFADLLFRLHGDARTDETGLANVPIERRIGPEVHVKVSMPPGPGWESRYRRDMHDENEQNWSGDSWRKFDMWPIDVQKAPGRWEPVADIADAPNVWVRIRYVGDHS